MGKNQKHEIKRKAERKLMRILGALSPAWIMHKLAIKNRVARNEAAAKDRSRRRQGLTVIAKNGKEETRNYSGV